MLTVCILAEHALLVLKLYVAVRLPDAPLWVLKSRAYADWLARKVTEEEILSVLERSLWGSTSSSQVTEA